MTHRNAPLTPQGRYRLVMRVQAGRPIAHVAAEAGIARATLSKWVARYRQGGVPALEDRSSAPFHCPARTSAETVDLIEHWRRTHKWSARRISHELAVRGTVVSARTVTRWLDRAGLNRRRDTRPHRTDQSGRQTDPGPLPGPHDPPGRQEGRTHPTWGRLAGSWARYSRGEGLQAGQGHQGWLHLPAHRHRRLLTSGPHRGPRRVRRPPPRSASSAARGPSSPPTASPGSCGSLPTTGRTTAPNLHRDHHLPGLTPPEDPPLHPTPQRQGRALQPHPGKGVPLRASLLLTAAAP